MEIGIYEQIINQLFKVKLEQVDEDKFYIGKKPIDKDNVAEYLSQYLFGLFKLVFSNLTEDVDVSRGVNFANEIIKKLGREFNIDEANLIDEQQQILTAVVDKAKCDYPDIAEHLQQIIPITSLSHSSLFTGCGINMFSELQREIESADEICLLVSFIKTSGLNLIYDDLKNITDKGKHLRVITTTYMQATDFKAVKRLALLKNASVKVSYNSDADRLHAKSYIFLRNSGFHTAYIGSSNLSEPALREGLEWNMKVTQVELPYVIKKICHTFEGYWHSDIFETYQPGIDDDRLRNALDKSDVEPIDYSILDLISAHDYQEEILEKLRIDREMHHHFRNLVVAATGTGKTVIAAFDYKKFRTTHERAKLLFVAHRQEILEQSMKTFRQVLGDYNFGDTWYGGKEPDTYEYVFASKDILNNRLDELHLTDDYYDYIVIDEVHHVAADSYRRIIHKFKPKILLGLTATPERMDGEDITQDFDGHISAEIRLDTALNNHLLCPFRYYGITDSVDLKDVAWEHGHYVAQELSKVYTNNDARTGVIFNSLQKYIDNPHQVKALCFCVDKQHADYMAAKFTLAGLKADKLTSDNSEARTRLGKKLKAGEINYLFVVDMFNEGVDLPEIDTVLFLRPTESLTIFLQQFGRGLRKSAGKPYVTVLDYVGQCRAEFDYTNRFRAIIGRTSMSVMEELDKDFPHLPIGCQIHLEYKAKEYIKNNISQAIRNYSLRNIQKLVDGWRLKFTLPLTLKNFELMYKVPLEKIYNKHTFSELAQKKIFHGEELAKAVHNKWLSTDSYSYFSFIRNLAVDEFNIQINRLPLEQQKLLLMLYYDLYQRAGAFDNLQQMADELHEDKSFCSEVIELMDLFMDRCETFEEKDNSNILGFPLKLHGRYTRDQIRVAIETSTLNRMSSAREGVERNKTLNVEAMYVDIIKNREEGDSTNYDDHALSPDVFQWDTQNKVTPNSTTGQNYINSVQNMLLFVREQSKTADDKTRTMGYVYLGKVKYISHTYNHVSYGKQMQIRWKMVADMPASLYQFAKYKVAL